MIRLLSLLLACPRLPHSRPTVKLLPKENELIRSCLFTYGLEFWTCADQQCPKTTLAGADYQERLERYYEANEPPPVEEALLVARLPQADSIIWECPGMLITSYLLLAEVNLWLDTTESRVFLLHALQARGQVREDIRGPMEDSWPIEAALARYYGSLNLTADVRQKRQEQGFSVGFVVARCREDLRWMREFSDMLKQIRNSTLFLFEKCPNQEVKGESSVEGLFSHVQIVGIDDGPVRQDECSAYMAFLTTSYDNIPDYTLFLQGDALDHMNSGLFSVLLTALAEESLIAEFMHLNSPRLVLADTQCKRQTYALIFPGSEPPKLSTYCCAQFIVSRARLLSQPLQFYQAAAGLLPGSDSWLPGCAPVPKHSTFCLMLESLWHVIWGAPARLPTRERDVSLDPIFRVPEGQWLKVMDKREDLSAPET